MEIAYDSIKYVLNTSGVSSDEIEILTPILRDHSEFLEKISPSVIERNFYSVERLDNVLKMIHGALIILSKKDQVPFVTTEQVKNCYPAVRQLQEIRGVIESYYARNLKVIIKSIDDLFG